VQEIRRPPIQKPDIVHQQAQAQTNFRRRDQHKIHWMQGSKEFTLGSAKIASVMLSLMPK
jgi:hypothetical protein